MRENAQAVRNLEYASPCLLLLFLVAYVTLALQSHRARPQT